MRSELKPGTPGEQMMQREACRKEKCFWSMPGK